MSLANYIIAFQPDDDFFVQSIKSIFKRNNFVKLTDGQYVVFSNLSAESIMDTLMKSWGEFEQYGNDPWYLIVEPINHIRGDFVTRLIAKEA